MILATTTECCNRALRPMCTGDGCAFDSDPLERLEVKACESEWTDWGCLTGDNKYNLWEVWPGRKLSVAVICGLETEF